MIAKIQLQKDATVLAADGKEVGSLERVVVNPNSNVLTDIVVRTGTLLNQKEKVVSVELVAETTEDRVLLREAAGDLESFPQFEEERIVGEYGGEDPASPPANMYPGGIQYPMGAPTTPASGERIVTRIEQNIPEGTVAMKEGAKVITADGKNVGSVERVLADPSEEQITHLLISKGLLMKEKKLIPIKWVMMMGEDKVHLRVNKDSVDELDDMPVT